MAERAPQLIAITITDEQWSKITHWIRTLAKEEAKKARPCLESALTLYSQRREARDDQPRASKTKKDLQQIAGQALELRKSLAGLDPYALMALGDEASKVNSERTGSEALRMVSHPRMETVALLRDAILRTDRLSNWAANAAGQIESMTPGASAATAILDLFVWQAAMVLENYADRQLSNCMACRRYLRALLDVVDQPVTDNAIEEAARNAEELLSKFRS